MATQEDEYIPLETEVFPINQVPEDIGDAMPATPAEKKKKLQQLVTTKRGQKSQSYSAQIIRPYSAGGQVLNPSLDKPVDIGDTKTVQYKIAQYKTDRRRGLELGPGDEEVLIGETEDGEIVGIIAKVNNINMILEIAVFGDTDTYYVINDLSVSDLIEEGAGMAPGDIAPTGVISPDNAGQPDDVFVTVQRFKADTGADILGATGEIYVVKYTPAIPFPYKAISVSLRNNSTARATILSARMHRIVYSTLDQEIAYSTKL